MRRRQAPAPLRAMSAAGASPAALAALGFVAAIVGGAFAGLLAAAPRGGGTADALSDPWLWHVVRFTLWQAGLSTLLSLLFALPVARALARQARFPGRGAFIRLMSLPLALPQLVAVLGLLSVWGTNGWLARAASAAGIPSGPDIYGLGGILLAHVFFNMPLAVRLFTAQLERLPGEYWRLSAQLGMSPRGIWRFVEWPALRAAIPGAAALVFMLCATSFTVVLTLGGGPAATTLEVAIYEALRFDFDPARAVLLALLQVAMTTALFILVRRFAAPLQAAAHLQHQAPRPDAACARRGDAFWLLVAAAFTAAPLAGIITSGLGADLPRLLTDPALHRAVATSALVAAAASALSMLLCLSLLQALEAPRPGGASEPLLAHFASLAASLVLVVPPLVLSAGWFVILHAAGRVEAFAPLVVIVVNALMALPFVWRIMRPAFIESRQRYARLCAQLGLRGSARLRLVDWPVLRRPAALALALAAALSIGDLGAIALFGSQDFRTLPWLLYSRLGSYRTQDAAGLALILLAFVLLLMAAAERAARRTP